MMECYDNRIDSAMLPTKSTLRRRSSIAFQLVRFAQINIRMVKMVLKAHN